MYAKVLLKQSEFVLGMGDYCNITFDTPSNASESVYTFTPYQAVIVVYNGSVWLRHIV